MTFKCFSCGVSFDTVEEFMEHRRLHQEPPEKRGLVCMNCRRDIPIDASLENYVGDIHCRGCGQKMKVRIEDGEVLFVATRQE
ncbi:MAG: hypothetical protein DRI39_10785 [Chloroflexi bacterium]|nr:MAG: hypothetical protein DRI39_10785 [Chloroflexota bacterium]RLC95408.1 MAG: hypothetical protein DRI40_05935 [Chloroflexota bacterium]